MCCEQNNCKFFLFWTNRDLEKAITREWHSCIFLLYSKDALKAVESSHKAIVMCMFFCLYLIFWIIKKAYKPSNDQTHVQVVKASAVNADFCVLLQKTLCEKSCLKAQAKICILKMLYVNIGVGQTIIQRVHSVWTVMWYVVTSL